MVFTAVCWPGGCTYKNVLTADCKGGANPGNMHRCETTVASTEASQTDLSVSPNATPEVTQVTPAQAAAGESVTVRMDGRNFSSGVSVSTANSAIQVESTRQISATQIETKLTVGKNAPAGTVSLYVNNPASRTTEAPFTVLAAQGSPPSPGVAPATAVDLGTTWTVIEDNTWFGTWTRRAGTNVFDAVWKNRSAQVAKDTLELQPVEGVKVTLYRVGMKGKYTGTLAADGKHLTGTASWYRPDQNLDGHNQQH